MKKQVLLLTAIVSLLGCNTEQEELDKIEAPIIVVAIEGKERYERSVVLSGGDGKLHAFGSSTETAQSIAASRKVGDTISIKASK